MDELELLKEYKRLERINLSKRTYDQNYVDGHKKTNIYNPYNTGIEVEDEYDEEDLLEILHGRNYINNYIRSQEIAEKNIDFTQRSLSF
jgi:hypothetical protein